MSILITNIKSTRPSALTFALLILLISAALIFTPTLTYAESADSLATIMSSVNGNGSGDINKDGVVDISDLVMCLAITHGTINPTTYQSLAADMNSDGIIDINDVALLNNRILNSSGKGSGDVNGDGIVDFYDLTMCIDIVLEIINPTTYQSLAADMNSDGTIDISDMVLLNNLIPNTYLDVIGSGDINNDGVVDISDLAMCLAITHGTINPTTYQSLAADMNGDGTIDISDVMLLNNLILNSQFLAFLNILVIPWCESVA